MTSKERFCAEYLKAQGVIILPKSRRPSAPIGDRVAEFVPVVPEYERD
jgi:hypothetical protein